ncbi:uncharacterized protein LOC115217832 [Octopus sinensis]|uniref:Uncharacterized protein LOC115217832 n=1 Tax=Octopus sinensis TaxID=2607531 RepID=A0A6P7SYZ3_9MOLL|nr:uncharacterized protein LOC115217832 [Octopus sinensis]
MDQQRKHNLQEFLYQVTRQQHRSHDFTYIPSSLTGELRAIITAPPAVATYSSIKIEILKRTSLSSEKKFSETSQRREFSRPNTIADAQQNAAAHSAESKLLKQLFSSKLPQYVQGILTHLIDVSTVDQLAASADKILEYTKSSPEQNNSPLPVAIVSSEFKEFRESTQKNIDKLFAEVHLLCINRNSSPRRYRHSNSRSPSRSKPFCWHHYKFGSSAKKCISPYTFKTQENLKSRTPSMTAVPGTFSPCCTFSY